MRGAAPAGAGTSVGYTQNETLALGTKYNDQLQGHWHNSTVSDTAFIVNAGAVYGLAATTNSNESVRSPVTDGVNGIPRTGNVTRGKRVGLNFIIKV
jgi:hypothetical protein